LRSDFGVLHSARAYAYLFLEALWELQHHVPTMTTFPFDILRTADRQKTSTVSTSVKLYPQTYQPVWLRLARDPLVRKAQAQRGLNASQVGMVIYGEPSRSGSDVLKLSHEALMDLRVLDSVRSACTIWQLFSSRLIALGDEDTVQLSYRDEVPAHISNFLLHLRPSRSLCHDIHCPTLVTHE
jgi:hypothetical protein